MRTFKNTVVGVTQSGSIHLHISVQHFRSKVNPLTSLVTPTIDNAMSVKSRRSWWRRELLALMAMLLFFAGMYSAIHGWQVMIDFGPVVEKAGGKYNRTESFPLFTRTLRRINGIRSARHQIRFSPGQVNDAWMHRHGNELRTLSNLQLTLKGTQITDVGFQELKGHRQLQSLELRQSRLGSASAMVFETMPALASLNIAHTDMMATDLSPRCLRRLTYLCLDASQIDHAGIETLKSVFGKTGTVIRHVRLYDADAVSLERLRQLRIGHSLELMGDPVSSECLPLLVQLVQSNGLKQLLLDDSKFTRDETLNLRNAIGGCLLYQMSQDQYDRMEEASVPQSAKGLW